MDQEIETKMEQLKVLLEQGKPFDVALKEIGETRDSFIMKQLDKIKVRSNTVGGCGIGFQYCGCELYV